jgi:DNA ligase-1
MQAFTSLYLQLDGTTSTSEKIDALAIYFQDVPHADGAWAIAFLTGERPKGTASSRVLHTLAVEQSGVPAWLFEECRAVAGDMAETISLMLPPSPRATGASRQTLTDVVEQFVLPLVGAAEDRRRDIIMAAWSSLGGDARFVYLKMIRGGFRVGVQRRLLARALAHVADVDQAIMEHRLAGGVDPTARAFADLIAPEDDEESRRRPYPFFLAHPLQGDVAALEALGDLEQWMAEWKWDGIRAQLARRDDAISIWSRGEEIITTQFPEIAASAASLPVDTVLDGEVLLWTADGSPAPFAALQTRLNRKKPKQPSLFETQHPTFMAFDVLEHGGVDVRSRPQRERRAMLERLIAGSGNDTLRLSPSVRWTEWSELADHRSQSRSRGVEGLVLKHADAPYLSGRVKPDANPGWLKWKVDPYTIDAVLVHALPGSGRRATLYTDYAFAVWSADRTELVVFTRAYSGLAQDEIEELDGWIRRNTRARRGPFREVQPQRVFEIAFEGIAESSRHKAGIAVRFPRILRERTDKQVADADSIEELRALMEV